MAARVLLNIMAHGNLEADHVKSVEDAYGVFKQALEDAGLGPRCDFLVTSLDPRPDAPGVESAPAEPEKAAEEHPKAKAHKAKAPEGQTYVNP